MSLSINLIDDVIFSFSETGTVKTRRLLTFMAHNFNLYGNIKCQRMMITMAVDVGNGHFYHLWRTNDGRGEKKNRCH